jgi:hypothetical protein
LTFPAWTSTDDPGRGQNYRESAAELAASWRDRRRGMADFATILERAAEQCRKAINKRGIMNLDALNIDELHKICQD